MKNVGILIASGACLMLMLAQCSNNESATPAEEASGPDPLAGTPFTREVENDTCLFIAHKISEYDLWKASYDLAQPIREKHGIHTLNVYRDAIDTSMVMVFTSVNNLAKGKDYITSDNLKKQMQQAGVEGEMDLYWVSNNLAYTKEITDTLLMFMSFNVLNYDRWEDAFLQDYRDEPNRDFQVVSVLRGVDDNGQVCMLFAVNDPDYVKTMEGNAAFRMKMLAAGVISYPVTYRLRNMPL